MAAQSEDSWAIEKGSLKFTVHRRGYKRYHKLFLDDFVFEINLSPAGDPKQHVPFLVDMHDILKQGIESIVQSIQKIFPSSGKHKQIYITFTSSALDGGFPTRNFQLHSDKHSDTVQASFIADVTLQCLSDLLRSASHINVSEDNVTLLITVLSQNRIEHLDKRNDQRQVLTYTAGRADPQSEKLTLRFIKKTRQNCLDFDKDINIPGSCAVASVVYGTYMWRASANAYNKDIFVESATEFRKIKGLKQKTRNTHAKCKLHFEKLIKGILRQCNLPQEGPYDLEHQICTLADFLKVQLHVYSNRGMKKILSHPIALNLALPQIYLFQNEYDENLIETSSSNTCPVYQGLTHIELITNVESFFNKFPIQCLRCSKFVQSLRRHICYSKKVYPSCFSCQNIIVDNAKNFCLTRKNIKQFCIRDKNITSIINKKCEDCHVICSTLDCWNKHHTVKNCCNRGTVCQRCKRFIMNKGKNKDINSHNCHEETCKVCWEKYDSGSHKLHFCPMKQPSNKKQSVGLTFFDLETICDEESNYSSMCLDCLSLEIKYLDLPGNEKLSRTQLKNDKIYKEKFKCEKHKNINNDRGKDVDAINFHTCTLAVCLFEDEMHGFFSKVTFQHPELPDSSEDCVVQKNYFICPQKDYYDSTLWGQPVDRSPDRKNKNRKPFVHEPSHNNDYSIGLGHVQIPRDDFLKMMPELKMIYFFVQEKYRNQVIKRLIKETLIIFLLKSNVFL